jgi:hypothetical protein
VTQFAETPFRRVHAAQMQVLLLVKAPTTVAPDPGAPMAPGLWCSRCVRAGSRLGWRTLGLKEIALFGHRLTERERGGVVNSPHEWIARYVTSRMV